MVNTRAVGAAEAHLVYTEGVVGSNPTPPIYIRKKGPKVLRHHNFLSRRIPPRRENPCLPAGLCAHS